MGNKVDLVTSADASFRSLRQVTAEEAESLAQNYGARYIETSAKTNENVDELFNLAARYAHAALKAKKFDSDQHGSQDQLSNTRCLIQ